MSAPEILSFVSDLFIQNDIPESLFLEIKAAIANGRSFDAVTLINQYWNNQA
ncbi:MAG: hypothetical protein RLZZ69_3950 [Cyanobacteriota bacterium]|jgi:hypothetical protein